MPYDDRLARTVEAPPYHPHRPNSGPTYSPSLNVNLNIDLEMVDPLKSVYTWALLDYNPPNPVNAPPGLLLNTCWCEVYHLKCEAGHVHSHRVENIALPHPETNGICHCPRANPDFNHKDYKIYKNRRPDMDVIYPTYTCPMCPKQEIPKGRPTVRPPARRTAY